MRRVVVATILGLVLAAEARADVPGPREVCEPAGLTCETCWESYSSGADDKARFEACAAPLREKGYTEGCRDRQGAGDQVFFCANGGKPKLVTRNFGGGGGCAGCALGRGHDGNAALATVALALAGAVCRRRRR